MNASIHSPTVVHAFTTIIARDASLPLMTFYDDATGERTELSGATLANWVSKTANLLFIHELARRLTAIGSEVVAAAAHPGYAATNLQTASPSQEGRKAAERFMRIGNRFFAQSAESGALPTLYAATAPDVRPDSFTGPAVMGWRGSPARSWRAPWSLDDRAGELLWEESERLTGVVYEELKR